MIDGDEKRPVGVYPSEYQRQKLNAIENHKWRGATKLAWALSKVRKARKEKLK